MGIKFKTNHDEMLHKVKKESKQLSNDVSFNALFNKKFMSKYTNFSSFAELLTDGNFVLDSKKDFADIPKKELDKHLTHCTKFTSWKEMYSKAGDEYFGSNSKL